MRKIRGQSVKLTSNVWVTSQYRGRLIHSKQQKRSEESSKLEHGWVITSIKYHWRDYWSMPEHRLNHVTKRAPTLFRSKIVRKTWVWGGHCIWHKYIMTTSYHGHTLFITSAFCGNPSVICGGDGFLLLTGNIFWTYAHNDFPLLWRHAKCLCLVHSSFTQR